MPRLRPRDEANMRIVQEVANGINPSIQVTIDCPSGHSDLKMPILDLKVWPSNELDVVTRETSVMILHEHYHKEVASRAVVNARSALPATPEGQEQWRAVGLKTLKL